MRGERFHIFGDLCGHLREFRDLLRRLNYDLSDGETPQPPPGRVPVSVGNLIGSGDDSMGMLRVWMDWTLEGRAVVVPGENEESFYRYIRGDLDDPGEALSGILEQISQVPDREAEQLFDRFTDFYTGLPPFRILNREVIVTHAGFDSGFLNRPLSPEVREQCIEGVEAGEEEDEAEPPSNGELGWMWQWDGLHRVVAGHTPVRKSRWVNRCINLNTGPDSGCRVTMLKLPEMELHSIPARRYTDDPRPVSDWPL